MKWQYSFESRIVHHMVGTYRYTVVFLPAALAEELPFDKSRKLRFRGLIGAAPFHGAWQPVRGRWYCMLSKKVIARSGYDLAEMAIVRFNIESSDMVSIPELLQSALNANHQAKCAWQSMSAGKQRGLSYQIYSAKRPETQAKRLQQVLSALEEKSSNSTD